MMLAREYEPKWILVMTEPRREKWAAENVVNQGFSYYLPVIEKRSTRKVNGISHLSTEPLFPRYLFVRIKGEWRTLLSTFGVTGVILSGDSPSIVPESIVEQLRERENELGCIDLPEPPPEIRRLSIDQRVKVTEGPFANYAGVYKGQATNQRVRVLLDALHGKVSALIVPDSIEPF